jgi:hypothetical protein
MTPISDNNESKDRTLASIERKLQSFPKIEPPENLEVKLMAMSQTHIPPIRNSFLALHTRLTRFATSTAAALLILSFILMIEYGLTTGPSVSFAQFDTSLRYPAYDVNYLLLSRDNNTSDKIVPVNFNPGSLPRK